MAWIDLLIGAVALGASLLTFITGFGLGTLLLPILALFFPLEVAITLTAIVHLFNNILKLGLVHRAVEWGTALRYGVTGMLGAWGGVQVLAYLSGSPHLYPGMLHPVSALAVVAGLLMLVFAAWELAQDRTAWSVPPRYQVLGGIISGFFGGLTGHQGALRSLFLLRCGLTKEAFVATGVAIALFVDLTRIPFYVREMPTMLWLDQGVLLALTTCAAATGALMGKWLLPKITVRTLRSLVGYLMMAIGLALITGLIRG